VHRRPVRIRSQTTKQQRSDHHLIGIPTQECIVTLAHGGQRGVAADDRTRVTLRHLRRLFCAPEAGDDDRHRLRLSLLQGGDEGWHIAHGFQQNRDHASRWLF